jgi:hypothetical protein
MATLFGTKIQDTYDGLLKVTDNIGITGTKKFITDGLGVNSSVKISSLDFEVANFFFIDVLSGQDPSNYKVGINTSSPTQMLHVVGNMRLTGAFYDSNNATGTSGQILSSTASGTDWVDITAIQTLSGSGTTNYLTKWTNTSVLGNSILYETSSKIGIGTITPSEKLHVDGNLALQGQINLMVVNEIYGIIKPEFAKINYYLDDGATTTGTPTITMSGDGHSRLGIGVASPDEALHVVGDALITGDSHADTFKPAVTANPIKFKNFASTELMRITDTGLVGIANNSPSYTLDVSGTARVSGDTYFVTQANSDDSNKVATTAYVKNLIEEIPAGLIFQGTWNASTNTPTLTSGSGTTGHFYIVSTDGSTNLDGITDWKVGDWAVFVEQGVTDQWEKIDNSSVLDGSGTGQKVTLWSGSGTSNTLTDAPITVDGNDVKITSSGDTNLILQSASPGSTSLDFYEGTAEKAHVTFDTVNNVLTMGRASGGLSIDNSGNTTFAGDISASNANITTALDVGSFIYVGGNNSIFAENNLRFKSGGAAYIDHNTVSQSIKFRLSNSSSLDVTPLEVTPSYLSSTVDMYFGDNDKIRLGASSDLQIYHDGSISKIIEAGSTELQISSGGSNLYLQAVTGENAIKLIPNNSVELYYNGSKKFETTNTGVTVTGQITTTGTSPSIIFNETDVTANWRNRVSSGSYRVQYASDGSTFSDYFVLGASANTVVKDTTFTGTVTVNTANSNILTLNRTTSAGGYMRFQNDGTDKFYIGSRGTVSGSGGTGYDIYAVGGNDIRFFPGTLLALTLDTSANATFTGSVGIGLTNPQAPLSFANVVGSKIDFYHNTTSSDRYGIEVQSSELRIHSGAQGNSTGGITFGKKTTSTFTEAMRITNAGSVGIGTTLPKTSLDIVKNSDIWHLMVGGLTKKLLVGGQAASGDVVLQAGAASTANNAAVTTAYNLCLQRDGGNVGVGNANPQSKLHVAGGIQMANDTDTASASKVGTLKYYTSGNNSYVDMCMQTGATTYEWINIVQNNW